MSQHHEWRILAVDPDGTQAASTPTQDDELTIDAFLKLKAALVPGARVELQGRVVSEWKTIEAAP